MIKTKTKMASPLPATSCQKPWKLISRPSWKVASTKSCRTGQPGILSRWVVSGYYGNLDASLCYCFFIEAATVPIKKTVTCYNMQHFCMMWHFAYGDSACYHQFGWTISACATTFVHIKHTHKCVQPCLKIENLKLLAMWECSQQSLCTIPLVRFVCAAAQAKEVWLGGPKPPLRKYLARAYLHAHTTGWRDRDLSHKT